MPKKSVRSASNKRLEALLRAQRMSELLKIGGMQSQALLDSAGESRPTDESHVVELLDKEKYTRSEMSGSASRAKKKSRPRSVKRASPKRKRRR
jgi:hypothetical protein